MGTSAENQRIAQHVTDILLENQGRMYFKYLMPEVYRRLPECKAYLRGQKPKSFLATHFPTKFYFQGLFGDVEIMLPTSQDHQFPTSLSRPPSTSGLIVTHHAAATERPPSYEHTMFRQPQALADATQQQQERRPRVLDNGAPEPPQEAEPGEVYVCVTNVPGLGINTFRFPSPARKIASALHKKFGIRTDADRSFIAPSTREEAAVYVWVPTAADRSRVLDAISRGDMLVLTVGNVTNYECKIYPQNQPSIKGNWRTTAHDRSQSSRPGVSTGPTTTTAPSRASDNRAPEPPQEAELDNLHDRSQRQSSTPQPTYGHASGRQDQRNPRVSQQDGTPLSFPSGPSSTSTTRVAKTTGTGRDVTVAPRSAPGVEAQALMNLAAQLRKLWKEINSGVEEVEGRSNIAEEDVLLKIEKGGEIEAVFPVYGIVKAGKSTFLSCVLRETILPAQALPMTSIPIKISHRPGTRKTLLLKEAVKWNQCLQGYQQKLAAGSLEIVNENDQARFEVQEEIRKGNVRFVPESFGEEDISLHLTNLSHFVRLLWLNEIDFESDYEISLRIGDLPEVLIDMKAFRNGPVQRFSFLDTPGPNEAKSDRRSF